MRYVTALVAFILTFGLTAVAYAQGAEAVDPSAASQFIGYAIEVASALLVVLLTWASAKLGVWVKAKTGVEVDGMLEKYAARGVAYAEEKAHQYLQANSDKMKGSDKLEIALEFAISLAEANNLPEKGKDKLVGYIESKLGEARE